MPKGMAYDEATKEEIKAKLLQYCRQSWSALGYKKTCIQDICRHVSISVGTFYAFFATKEDLFYETASAMRDELQSMCYDILQETPGLNGFIRAMKAIYRVIDQNQFMYEANSLDFLAFVAKLSPERIEIMKDMQYEILAMILREANLKLKLSMGEIIGITGVLLDTIGRKEEISLFCDHFTIYDHMVESILPTLVEE